MVSVAVKFWFHVIVAFVSMKLQAALKLLAICSLQALIFHSITDLPIHYLVLM